MTLHKFSVGAVLAVAMVGVLGLGALVFSSRDFQFGVAQVAPSTNGRVDFADLERVSNDIAEIRRDTAETQRAYTEVQDRIAALDRAEAAVSQSRAEIVGDIATIEGRANIQGGAVDQGTAALSQRINSLAGQQGLSPEDRQGVATLASEVNQLAQAETAVAASTTERASLNARYSLIGEQVAQIDSRVHQLQAAVVPERENFDRIRNEARSLQSLSVLGLSAYFAQGHPSLLSTLLVLLMGALGSLLYLFPAYLNRAEPVTMAEIFVRLVFGMCAALSLYVLANAAIAGFSIGAGGASASAATTSSLLNPFTVSLVGIVAGVLSEDIAKWIQERGRGVFTQGGGGGGSAPRAASPPPPPEPAPGGGLVNNEAIQ